MDLNLIDKLTLLALDDDKGTFITGPLYFTYSIAGAVLLELNLKNKIEILDKRVIVKSKSKIGEPLLDKLLDQITNSKKQRYLQHWVQSFGNKEREIKRETLNKLMSRGILTKKEDKFLWVFPNTKYPTKNAIPENELRQRLCSIIENDKKAEVDEIMLLSLIDACNLIPGVFGKKKAKGYKKKIKALVDTTLSSNLISATVKEVHDIIIALLIVMMTTTVIVTSN